MLSKPVRIAALRNALSAAADNKSEKPAEAASPKAQSPEAAQLPAASPEKKEKPEEGAPASGLIPCSVLAVDDNPANLKLMKIMLSAIVTEPVMASSGEEAVSIAGERKLDLILMDIQMPVMDGVSAMKAIRKEAAPTPLLRSSP